MLAHNVGRFDGCHGSGSNSTSADYACDGGKAAREYCRMPFPRNTKSPFCVRSGSKSLLVQDHSAMEHKGSALDRCFRRAWGTLSRIPIAIEFEHKQANG